VISVPFFVDQWFEKNLSGRILYMLMDGGKHPSNLQPYLECVVEDMATLERKGFEVDGRLWRTFYLYFYFLNGLFYTCCPNIVLKIKKCA
jgi:hypothetical protein